jgi:hypothetical protein
MEPPLSVFADDSARVAPAPSTSGAGARSKAPPLGAITAAAILFAAAVTLVMFWTRLQEVWFHGAFHNPDDAMRLVEVRALLAGQHWFDMTAYGLDPPFGASMHWSRVVDLPIAVLIKLFGLFTDVARAEILARLVFPFVLLLALFAGVAAIADTLLGPAARLPAIGTALFCGCAIVQFQPGRIAHHAPQIVTLVFMVGAALRALDPARARHAALAGVLAGLSLAISLENLPFILGLSGMLVAFWIWRGAACDRALRFFALGLAGGLLPFFLATVGPTHWFDSVCDAFGAAHLGAGLIGAAGCAILGVQSRRLPTRAHRLAAAAAVAAPVVAYVGAFYPDCLHDPFAKVAPLVRTIWISNVSESFPFMRFLKENPVGAALSFFPVAMGLCGCLAAAALTRGTTAARFLLLAVLSAIGLALVFWQIRVFTSVTPLAIMGGLPLAVWAHDRARARGQDILAIFALCLVFPFTSFAWIFVLPDEAAARNPPNTCMAPQSFAPLAALPPGRVVAPIDSGAFFLAHTGLSVFAAPYHRNNDGNLLAFESFMAKPDAARAMLAARGVDYVMICNNFGETQALANRAPDGLAAALLAGKVPDWLVPVAVRDSPYSVFRPLSNKK